MSIFVSDMPNGIDAKLMFKAAYRARRSTLRLQNDVARAIEQYDSSSHPVIDMGRIRCAIEQATISENPLISRAVSIATDTGLSDPFDPSNSAAIRQVRRMVLRSLREDGFIT